MALADVPVDWRRLLLRIRSERLHRVVIIGASLAARDILSDYLFRELSQDLSEVVRLEIEPGPGRVHVPAMIALERSAGEAVESYFLGSYAPVLHTARLLTGVAGLAARAGSGPLLCASASFVHGDGGRLLQELLLETLQPELIVLLEQDRMLEHLVIGQPVDRVMRIKIDQPLSSWSAAERREEREQNWCRYFTGAAVREYPWPQISFSRCFLGSGVPLPEALAGSDNLLHVEQLPGWEGCLAVSRRKLAPALVCELEKRYGQVRNSIAGVEQGMVVGLADAHGHLLGLGIVETLGYSDRVVRLITPVTAWQQAVELQFGSIRLTAAGREIGFVAPGGL